jgi:hypothetical protein
MEFLEKGIERMKRRDVKKKGGFEYYRTKRQIREYMKVPPERKLKWLEEMWRFNREVALNNPEIAEIQEKFRRGEI